MKKVKIDNDVFKKNIEFKYLNGTLSPDFQNTLPWLYTCTMYTRLNQFCKKFLFSKRYLIRKFDRLKGQCHEIFDTFFDQKTPLGPKMNRQKRLCKIFCFREDICKKKTCVRVVVDYADAVLA